MKLSDAGLRFIAAEESFVPHVYVDFAGVDTIGYGHAVRPGERWTTITEAEGLELLRRDVASAEAAVTKLVTVELSQTQFDALVTFAFNVGNGSFGGSTLLRKLNAGDYAGAADEMLRWDKYTKGGALLVSDTLKKRRRKEREMFLREPVDEPAREPRPYSPNVQPALVAERERAGKV